MQTLESMRRRITSAEDLYAVVRVMKALASVSIRQYEKAVESLREYTRTVEQGLQVVLRGRPEGIAGESGGGDRWTVVVFGSEQGMCGSFNERAADFALEQLDGLGGKRQGHPVLAVGTRVVGRLEDAGCAIAGRFPVPGTASGITPVVNDLLLAIEEARFRGGIDRFLLVHHRPAAGGSSQPIRLQLLPLNRDWLDGLVRAPWPSRSLPTFTTDWRLLFAALVRQHLFVALYRALAESLASENAARLASMQAAEKNIQDHLTDLTARYHRERQQAITEELLDVVAGYETLTTEGRHP